MVIADVIGVVFLAAIVFAVTHGEDSNDYY